MGCSSDCRCSDFHGLTKEGRRYPLGNKPRCFVCGNLEIKPIENASVDSICLTCRSLMVEASELLRGLKGETIEARRILCHAAYYLLNRIKYQEFVITAEAEQWIANSVAIRYKALGPAYVLRKESK